MKSKLLSVLLCAIFSFAFGFGEITVSGEGTSAAVSEARRLVDGIIGFKLAQTESADIQGWIDGPLAENAGKSSEWYVFSLSRYESCDFSEYRKRLLQYLSENTVRSASERQKYSLVIAATGDYDSYISRTMNDSIGEQGVMSVIYGLHLINNGYKSDKFTAEEVIEKLLSLQTADGGWAVMGETGDTDVTAMAVQALAPNYSKNEKVTAAVDSALSLLSSKQLENGEYSSYGVSCPESTAQVLAALSSLGIDAAEDERFIKNNCTLIDGLGQFRLDDGSFCHELGKDFSESATVQTLYSLISYIRMSEGKSPLYILDSHSDSGSSETAETEASEAPAPDTENISVEGGNKTEESVNGDNGAEKDAADYKPTVCVIICAGGAVAALILLALGKKNAKNFLVLLVITAAALIFVMATDFQSAEDYYGSTAQKENPIGTVSMSIRCDTIVGKKEADYIPDNGIIVEDTFEIEEGEDVFDILIEAAKKHEIHLEYTGSSDLAYISGINYIYEFDFGDLSGWMYFVNGESPSVGCDKYVLSDGDRIEWLYSCELGNDLR